MFRKASIIHVSREDAIRWLLLDKWSFHTIDELVDSKEKDLVHLHMILGEQFSHFYVNVSSQLQNVWVMIWWNSLRQK